MDNAQAETIELEDPRYTKGMATQLTMEFDNGRDPSFPFQFYLGPKSLPNTRQLRNWPRGPDSTLDGQFSGWLTDGWLSLYSTFLMSTPGLVMV